MTKTNVSQFIHSMIRLTQAGRAEWHPIVNGYELSLSAGAVTVERPPESPQIVFAVKAPNGAEVARTSEDAGLQELFRAASEVGASGVFQAIEAAVENGQSPPDPSAIASAAMLPNRILLKDELEIFRRVQGRWRLDYSRGTEQVEISNEGLYTCGARIDALKPTFQLRLIAKSDDKKMIEWAKDTLHGTRFQIEVLTFDSDRPTTMIGEAKHDRHKLSYRRHE